MIEEPATMREAILRLIPSKPECITPEQFEPPDISDMDFTEVAKEMEYTYTRRKSCSARGKWLNLNVDFS